MSQTNEQPIFKYLLSVPVLVAALGYFVDIYDLLLFGIVRVQSLTSFGLNEEQVSSVGKEILNWQMTGLLLGGILWGVLGDKKGRLSVLFGSIITYSLANIACGFVDNPDTYKILRFVAGVGLAGELGAGITLISEILPKNIRAVGTSFVAGVGLSGAVVAYFTVKLFDWRTAYFVGGGLGITLLLLRVGVFESAAFKAIQHQQKVTKGDFFALFNNKNRFLRYLKCICIGLPTWFVIGILSTFANEFGKALDIPQKIEAAQAIMWCYVGLSVGDLLSGIISQTLASRKKAVAYMMIFTLVFVCVYLFAGVQSTTVFYALCALMGTGIGYWAMFVTIGAEQFGTNLRATATTTIPNMVRGTVVLMTTFYSFLKPTTGVVTAGALVGVICFLLGFWAITSIEESHGKDLDFLEE
jgi:MFS family permease